MTRGAPNSVKRRGAVASLIASAALLAIPAQAEPGPSAAEARSLSLDDSVALDAERQTQALPTEIENPERAGPVSAKPPSQGARHTAIPGAGEGPADVTVAPRDLPSGGASVSPQAVALPGGPSSVTGMGESFTTQLSTGIVSFTVPLKLLTARGGVQPRLDLAYSSAAGFGLAGKGWSLGASAISRQTDRGVPKYADEAEWNPEQDRFVFGGMELVPICTPGSVTPALACTDKLQEDEVLPDWANGWQYFRARIEGGFLRFFWSPDHRSWRIQSKDGGNFELGVPLDGSGYTGALEYNPVEPSQIFRWYIVRQYDSEGGVHSTANPEPVNAVVYRYQRDGEAVYLSDIFDTSPAADPTSTNLAVYAHHTRIVYEARPDLVRSFRSGWLVEHRLRVARVDVTSKPFTGAASAARELVRRYHLQYESDFHTSLLTSVQMEGRCESAVTEQSDQTLPLTSCPRLPALKFEYQRVKGSPEKLRDSSGYAFETFNEKLVKLKDSPPHSLDEALTGMMDVNADGLPDVVVTAPGLFGGKHAVFLNGVTPDGSPGFAGRSLITVENLGGIDANVLRFDNTNVAPLDLDADGLVNLVHMPKQKSYSVFTPVKTGAAWTWKGRMVSTASSQDVKIDFTTKAQDTKVMDVNGDGLVDVVYSSPTEVQTFFALGRYPGGHDQFGQATWTSASSATIKNDPVTSCAPWSGQTVRFSDPDLRIADLNGDGFPDIARVRSGQILYWPGRGTGYWGTGARQGCPAGELAQNRHIEMQGAPQFGVTRPGALLMNDVNGDGLSDIVEIRSQGVDIYLNDNGTGWTARHTIEGTPFLPTTGNFARLTDIDGSGTPDIVWGRADDYQYIDLTGGVSPHLLVRTQNGLGATTELQYASTTDVMRQAAAGGNPWTSFTPTVSPVLVRSTTRDHLEAVGRPAGAYVTEYAYRDPVYEGRQREFRGFREAVVKKLGDSTGPTVNQRSIFQLGECSENFQGSSADVCSTSLRWQDNWREPLKGLPVVSESFDEAGVYLSTEHTQYELRQLYTGLDGRRVSVAYPVGKNAFLYDTAAFTPAATTFNLDEVAANLPGITHTETRAVVRRATAGTARVRSTTVYDNFGNVTESIRDGCIEGCAAVDETITAHSEFELPEDDDSGWLWRESTSYITGSVHTDSRNQVLHTYNAQGKLLESHAVLSGTLSLDRTNEATAPAPPEASAGESTPADILLVENTYNEFGQVEFTKSSNHRCSSGTLDALYSQLPVTATAYVGPAAGDCGATQLIHVVTYDRGLEAPVTSVDATGQPAEFIYDGFGRVTSGISADPDNPGNPATKASFAVEYLLPQDPTVTPYSITIARALDGEDFNTDSYAEKWTFTDALGRTITTLTEADPDDAGDWIVGGAVEYNTKGEVIRTHAPWYTDDEPAAFDLGDPPPTSEDICAPRGSPTSENDAFGRMIRKYGRDTLIEVRVTHHAVSQDIEDAEDLAMGDHMGTHVTVVSDGHGRGIQRTQRIKVGMSIEQRHTLNEYLPTGEVLRVIQRKTGSTDVVRWLRYDSLGRMVLNAEPNTSPNFDPDPETPAGDINAWRYAYNDSGDMVGMSDARGCGSNYHYDAAGRLLAEDRWPCHPSHATYSAPNLSTGDGTEAFYRYDSADPDTSSIEDRSGEAFAIEDDFLPGRLASVSGLGSKTVFSYDALGRVIGTAVRVVKPGAPSSTLSSRYAPAWYTKTQDLDALDRPKTATTGLPGNATAPDPPGPWEPLLGSGGTSQLAFTYAKTGRIKTIGGSYGTLFAEGVYHADGRPDSLTLGDEAETQRTYCYDVKQRVSTVQTVRAEPGLWTTGSSPYTLPSASDYTTQLTLEDSDFSYDKVGNILEIEDFRTGADWPTGTKPLNRTFEYDDLYRLKRATYEVAGGGSDAWTSPYAAENASSTRVPQPSPHVSFTNRIQEQEFAYDWLGTPEQTRDDADGFWDRSLGDTTRGTAPSGPHRITAASNRSLAPSSTHKGDLSAKYDAAGNMTDLIVRRDGSCLPSTATSCWQRFRYEWNEVGELTRAERWDLTSGEQTGTENDVEEDPPSRSANAELNYTYDAGGSRVLKTSGTKHTVTIFSSLELRNTTWDTGASPNDYVFDYTTIHLLVPAGPATARIFYATESLPTLTSGQQHVFFNFPDHLGSTAFLIDKATGELVEFGTYQAYGAAESDHRPSRWAAFREPLRFSGKEEDIEVGLAYFGARYYSPYLSTWLSPDPVTIHGLGSDANPYAYVHGSPLMGIDPDGNEPITIGVIVTAAVIGAAVGAGSSIVYQGTTNGWDNINWGWDGVAGAAVSGAVSGAVSAGVGGAVGNLVGSQAVGGMIGGAAGSAAGHGATYVATGRSEGFGEGVLIGGASGLAGGAVGTGGGSKPDIGRAIAGSSTGAVAGTAVAAAFGGEVTAGTLMLSLGSGVAAVVASHQVPDSVKGWGSLGGTGGSGTAEPAREPALEPASGQGSPRAPPGSDRFLSPLPPSGDPLGAMFPELPPLVPQPVRAWGEGSRTVFEYGDGAREVRIGGSLAWRNNNPGNLRGSPDQIGRAHGFAVFSNEADGDTALRALLRSDRYSSLSIDRAIGRYAPAFENNTAAYRAAVRGGVGVPGSTRIDQLTNSQFDALVNTIRGIEGWRPGRVVGP